MITNYTELQASVANWLHRDDLALQIPDFITMLEARLNRVLAVSSMEVETSLACTVGSSSVSLPADSQTPIALWNTTNAQRDKLVYLQPQDMPFTTVAGYPAYWTIDSAALRFDKPADQSYPLAYRYYQRVGLSVAAPTNWLLTTSPDVYLYGTLLEAAPYMMNDQRISVWSQRYEVALKEMADDDNATKSQAILTTDVAPTWNRRFDINRGY